MNRLENYCLTVRTTLHDYKQKIGTVRQQALHWLRTHLDENGEFDPSSAAVLFATQTLRVGTPLSVVAGGSGYSVGDHVTVGADVDGWITPATLSE